MSNCDVNWLQIRFYSWIKHFPSSCYQIISMYWLTLLIKTDNPPCYCRYPAFDEAECQNKALSDFRKEKCSSDSTFKTAVANHDPGFFRKDSSHNDSTCNNYINGHDDSIESTGSRNESPSTDQEHKKPLERELSVTEQLRIDSRVNAVVETGSLADIRGSSSSEKKFIRSNTIQNSTASPPVITSVGNILCRRGHHIARLIQSKSELGDRPIYPNVPFSPYGSPCSSPQLKRKPLKESRRVSIEKNGEYIQLNQYKLKEAIGQVSNE